VSIGLAGRLRTRPKTYLLTKFPRP